jgi:hypothetical protein
MPRAALGGHGRCQRRDRRGRLLEGLRAGSCERLRDRFAAALTGKQDAAVSDRPRDRAADPRMANEPAIAVPHGTLKGERQFVPTAPSLDIDGLIACQATERDRSRPSPVAGVTRERDDRDRRASALELLPHSLASRELASPRTQPGRMRLRGLTSTPRVAQISDKRLARRAPSLSPAPRNMNDPHRTRALARRIPIFSAASARRRPALRAPLSKPCAPVAHSGSRALAPRAWSPSWSPYFWRELTFADSRWREPGCPQCAKAVLPARSDSQ